MAAKGIKATKQRMSVIGELCASEVPLTADDIYLRIRDQHGGKLSLSTVYRILDTLAKNEIVAKSGLLDGGKALYELISGMHRHNLICIKCHRMMPFGDCPLADFEKDLEDTTGFHISGHKMEIYGLCPDCNKPK